MAFGTAGRLVLLLVLVPAFPEPGRKTVLLYSRDPVPALPTAKPAESAASDATRDDAGASALTVDSLSSSRDTLGLASAAVLIGARQVESQVDSDVVGSASDPPVGVLTATPTSVHFGEVIVGDSSALPVMLENTGTASLTVSAGIYTGPGFGMSGLTLPLTLTPGQRTSFSADFAPAVTGPVTGQISITSNASDPTLVIALAGTGVNAHSAALSWNASTSKHVIGYNVYRGVRSGGPYAVLNAGLVSGTTYTDATVQAGHTYYYFVTAVNSRGVESLYSNQAQAVVPFP